MGEKAPPYLVVGQLSKVHGTKGEIFIWPLTDHPESSFAPGVVLQLADASGNAPDPFMPSVTIETVRPFKQGYLVGLEGIEDREGAERVVGRYLLRPFSEAQPLAEGEVFYHELLDMSVVGLDGEVIGRVVEVYELDPHHMLEVSGMDGRTHLIPFSAAVVRDVDTEGDRLVVDPPEGLLDL
jgi:16S rRNA processing protein RimM